MPPGQDRDEQALDHPVLADDHTLDLEQRPPEHGALRHPAGVVTRAGRHLAYVPGHLAYVPGHGAVAEVGAGQSSTSSRSSTASGRGSA
ncbi:hypothetical protein GCM10017559_44810 [Streptosporangium longisporum]|uniref:Uncharacterized protein n=1 Tax=Streptosporangium longisporum TaxID=46187 RepID=A0ABP6KQ72_9ACTN